MIGSFKSFLVEEEKTVYFTFGRMNPPTIGHEKLLDVLARKAAKNPYRVYLSQSQDKDKNPLQYKDKVKTARKMFPRHARSIMIDPKIKTVFHALVKLYDEGYKNVAMVVGSDRLREFDILLNKYNGKKGSHGLYNFRKIDVISAGARDPDAEGAEGMSASKMRAAAKTGDFSQFSQGLPKAIGNSEAKKIYNAVRSAMGLKEQKEFKNHVQLEPVSSLRESYIDGKLYEVGDTVVVKESGEVGTVKMLGSNYVIIENTGTQYRKWLDAIERVNEPKVDYIRFNEELEVADFSTKRQYDDDMTVSLEQLNEGKEGNQKVAQDKDVSKVAGTQPKPYYKGLKKKTKQARAAHFKAYAQKSDAEKKAAPYKKAPGDATAKTKPGKWTKKFKAMYDQTDISHSDLAKKRIDREKAADKIKHDRMMDRARMRDTRKTNRETT